MNKELYEKGYKVEQDFFGWSPGAADEQWKAVLKASREKSFEDCFSDVLQSQVQLHWDPAHPSTPLSQMLFKAVIQSLNKRSKSKCRLYCSLGTPLDYKFGVDGFFILGSNYLFGVTFDLALSASRTKLLTQKANVLITKSDLDCPKKLIEIGHFIGRTLQYAVSHNIRTTTRSILRQ